jgi:hypothetical protein
VGVVLGLLQLWSAGWIVNHNFSGMPRVPTHSLRILSYGECPNLGKSLIGSEGNFTSDSSLYLTLTTATEITTRHAAKMMQGIGQCRVWGRRHRSSRRENLERDDGLHLL